MPLPPLAFGHAVSRLTSSYAETAQLMSKVAPGLRIFDSYSGSYFRSRTVTQSIGDLCLMASARYACRIETGDEAGSHFVVPIAGHFSITAAGRQHRLLPASSSLVLPSLARMIEAPAASVVVIAFDPSSLQRTINAMRGRMQTQTFVDDRPRQFRLDRLEGMFQTFLLLCRMVDTTHGKEGLALTLGLNDMFYRWMAGIMLAQKGPVPEARRTTASSLDLVCGLVRHSVERPLTLTEMELASGLSARALQYAFKARFNCSPMEWQRRERMLDARQRLLSMGDSETITQVAHAMGFSSSAAFATRYKQQFGETPSQTLGWHRHDDKTRKTENH